MCSFFKVAMRETRAFFVSRREKHVCVLFQRRDERNVCFVEVATIDKWVFLKSRRGKRVFFKVATREKCVLLRSRR